MKIWIVILTAIVVSGCSSGPKTSATNDWVDHRSPATSPKENYEFYRYFVVDSTNIRLEAWREKDFKKVCNTEDRGKTDTLMYQIAFEKLRQPESPITIRLSKELGIVFRNYVMIGERDLPSKLDKACASRNKTAINKVMREINGISNLEGAFGGTSASGTKKFSKTEWRNLRTPAGGATAEELNRNDTEWVYESTKARLESWREGDFTKVCNALNTERGFDIDVYALMFGTFVTDDPTAADAAVSIAPFIKKFGKETYDRLLRVRQGHLIDLYKTCLLKDPKAISDVMKKIDALMSAEN